LLGDEEVEELDEDVAPLVLLGDVGEFAGAAPLMLGVDDEFEVAPLRLLVDVGEFDEAPPLMLVAELGEAEVLDEGDESIEDDDGDVIELELGFDSEVDDCELAEPPRADCVCVSRPLEPDRPCADWKERSALCVFGPMTPSIGPGS
jgi:hypothetical protein